MSDSTCFVPSSNPTEDPTEAERLEHMERSVSDPAYRVKIQAEQAQVIAKRNLALHREVVHQLRSGEMFATDVEDDARRANLPKMMRRQLHKELLPIARRWSPRPVMPMPRQPQVTPARRAVRRRVQHSDGGGDGDASDADPDPSRHHTTPLDEVRQGFFIARNLPRAFEASL